LLDTHAFIWALAEEERLSPKVRRLMSSSELWWSVVSLWEAIQKAQLGRLSLPLPAGPFLSGELSSNHVRLLPVSLSHVLRVESLPLLHRDPSSPPILGSRTIRSRWSG